MTSIRTIHTGNNSKSAFADSYADLRSQKRNEVRLPPENARLPPGGNSGGKRALKLETREVIK